MKILIVDDETISLKSMLKILKPMGDCETAQNGEEALEAFKKAWDEDKCFDFISLDIELPDIRGIEVLKKIRAMEKEKDIPKEKQVKIMMVTGSRVKTVVIECIKAGCNEYVAKPYDKDLIFKKLEKMDIKIKKDSEE